MHPQYARCLPRGGSHICLFAQCSNPGPGGMRHWGAQVQCSSWGLEGAGRAPPPPIRLPPVLQEGPGKFLPNRPRGLRGQEQLHAPSLATLLGAWLCRPQPLLATCPYARKPTDHWPVPAPHCRRAGAHCPCQHLPGLFPTHAAGGFCTPMPTHAPGWVCCPRL